MDALLRRLLAHLHRLNRLLRLPRPQCGSRAWLEPFSSHQVQGRIFENDLSVSVSVLMDRTPHVLPISFCLSHLSRLQCCLRFDPFLSHDAERRAPHDHPCIDKEIFESNLTQRSQRPSRSQSEMSGMGPYPSSHSFISLAIIIMYQIHPTCQGSREGENTTATPCSSPAQSWTSSTSLACSRKATHQNSGGDNHMKEVKHEGTSIEPAEHWSKSTT